MSILIAIVTGVLTCANYMWQTSESESQALGLVLQAVLAAVTIIALFAYKGKRTRKSHEIGMPRIFTLGFAAVLVSTLANVAVLVVFALFNFNVIQGL